MKVHKLCGLALSCWTLCATAQSLPDATIEYEFATHVKSTEEFRHRFNGTESYPGLDSTSPDFRRQNLYALLDREMNAAQKKAASAFVDRVLQSGVQLSFCDPAWFAVVDCKVTWKGQEKTISLTMCPECYKGEPRRWALCGARGIFGGLLSAGETSLVSPVEHEVSFAQLSSVFHHDLKNLPGYVADSHGVDQLSAFLSLAMAGTLKFSYVSDVKFVFLQVPGYVFTIHEVPRLGGNSGWLITNFSEVADTDKVGYMSKELGM